MQIGQCQLQLVSGGGFRLDGGAMFGVVPKPLWSKATTPDEDNRISLETNCLVIREGDDITLIDSGYGTKGTEKERGHIAASQPKTLVENLQDIGIERGDVTRVIPSHLHFDHAGGLTRLDEQGTIVPTFPNARHFVQTKELQDALGESPELVGNYFTRELQVLADQGLFQQVDGSSQISESIHVESTGGHTRGHQYVRVRSDGEEAVYLGDICPTSHHLKTFWTMAYDQFPLDVRRLKPKTFQKAVAEHHLVLFDHDPDIVAAYLTHDENGRIKIESSYPREIF